MLVSSIIPAAAQEDEVGNIGSADGRRLSDLQMTAAPASIDRAPVAEHRAWAALLTGNSENMTTLALVQMASLRRFSTYKTQ